VPAGAFDKHEVARAEVRYPSGVKGHPSGLFGRPEPGQHFIE
jgi:hypothetical protein